MIYHTSTGFPSTFTRPTGVARTLYTRHAEEKAVQRGIDIILSFDFDSVQIFEVEMQNDQIAKLGIRFASRTIKGQDVCLIIRPANRAWRVITTYMNASDDNHSTLRNQFYAPALNH